MFSQCQAIHARLFHPLSILMPFYDYADDQVQVLCFPARIPPMSRAHMTSISPAPMSSLLVVCKYREENPGVLRMRSCTSSNKRFPSRPICLLSPRETSSPRLSASGLWWPRDPTSSRSRSGSWKRIWTSSWTMPRKSSFPTSGESTTCSSCHPASRTEVSSPINNDGHRSIADQVNMHGKPYIHVCHT